MKYKPLFVKRSPLKKRRMTIFKFLMALSLIMVAIYLTRTPNQEVQPPWIPPVEPPGTVIITQNTDQTSSPKSTDIHKNTSGDVKSSAAVEAVSAKETTASSSPATVKSGDGRPVANQHDQGTDVSNEAQKAGLRQALDQWSKAWSNRDVPAYLAAYAEEFVPPKGMSRKIWEQSRSERIKGKKTISHSMQNVNLEIKSNTAMVEFTQVYSDERLKTSDKKLMTWVNRNGRWLIVREDIK